MANLFDTVSQPQIQDVMADNIIKLSENLFQQMVTIHQSIYNMVWNNKTVSPQQILDAIQNKGVPAGLIFSMGGNLVNLINSSKPGTLSVENYKPKKSVSISKSTGAVTVDMNDDSGTITLVD